jgi:tRNA(His) 5'-end guanylyltransferase
MAQTASALLTELHGVYAYTESDEISVLFKPEWDLFDREVEKLVSLSASIASATFTLAAQTPVHFDSRLWLGAREQQVVDYFRWRMADAERCCLNGWCYWTLRGDGASVGEATAALQGRSVGDKNELLFQHGINFNNLPAWQRRGAGIYFENFEKQGFDPIRQATVTATRRRVKVDDELPMKEAYAAFIRDLLAAVTPVDEEATPRP